MITKNIKYILLWLLLCSLSCITQAKDVNVNTIERVAVNAYAYYSNNEGVKELVKNVIPLKKKSETFAYICNFEKGFVIVSADDVAQPILGYGFSGPIDTANMAPAAKFLLDGYQEEIHHAKMTKAATSEEIQANWNRFINDSHPKVMYNPNTYLIQSTWDQRGHNKPTSTMTYNYYCPRDSITNQKTLVGCGGVATAQILRYWGCQCNMHGIVHNDYENRDMHLYNQNYIWESMTSTNPNLYNATLLYHCAFAINSVFGTSSTNSTMEEIYFTFRSNFGFDQTDIIYKDFFSTQAWIDTLKYHINKRTPILYSGRNSTSSEGHGWVVDGYDNNDYFHCNFGWGGDGDGYFPFNNVTPTYSSNGITYSHTYNTNFVALINIYPTDNVTTVLQNTTLYSGTQTGHTISVENCNINNNASVILDADCGTAIYGPFSMTTGSTLTIQ